MYHFIVDCSRIKHLFLVLLTLFSLNSNAQFMTGMSEKDLNESIGIQPKRTFSEGMQVNRYILLDGSILDYVFEQQIATMSIFYPANTSIDNQVKTICDQSFVRIRENRWHSKKGFTLCNRMFIDGKWRYECQQLDF